MAYKKYTAEQAKAFKQEMTNKVDRFLKDAMETKDGFDKLTAHYRISGLYSYSFYNNMMIYSQGGQICQSKANWAKHNRTIIAGEQKKIYVWMPIFKTVTLADGKKDQEFVGCKLVKTWEVSQTEGDALEYDHNSIDDLDIPYETLAGIITKLADSKVVETITGSARGWSDGENLTVSEWSNDTDKTKTLVHEYAHHVMHNDDKGSKLSRATKEVEAESVAYLVMSFMGVDFELSKNYVNNWKAGIQDIRTKKIVDVADKVIKEIKKNVSEEDLVLAKL